MYGSELIFVVVKKTWLGLWNTIFISFFSSCIAYLLRSLHLLRNLSLNYNGILHFRVAKIFLLW